MSEQAALERHSDDVMQPETSQSHDSDDEPMVYVAPKDYATIARQTRDRLIAEGADPILSSAKAIYQNSSNDKKENPHGVLILNDQCTAVAVASGFGFRGGRRFDLGRGSGATKRELRDLSEPFSDNANAGEVPEVPEKWLEFEKQAEERSGS